MPMLDSASLAVKALPVELLNPGFQLVFAVNSLLDKLKMQETIANQDN